MHGPYCNLLRQELRQRSLAFAKARGLTHVVSYGEHPIVVYEASPEQRRHGNFMDRAPRKSRAEQVPPLQEFRSFVAQRHQWIDAHGAARRDVACGECDEREECGDRCEVERVGGGDAVEQRAEKAR